MRDKKNCHIAIFFENTFLNLIKHIFFGDFQFYLRAKRYETGYPLQPAVAFLYPLKTLENLEVF